MKDDDKELSSWAAGAAKSGGRSKIVQDNQGPIPGAITPGGTKTPGMTADQVNAARKQNAAGQAKKRRVS